MAPNSAFGAAEKRCSTVSTAPENDDTWTTETELSVLSLGDPSPQMRQCSSGKHVSWANVHIREYPMIPGDNPAATFCGNVKKLNTATIAGKEDTGGMSLLDPSRATTIASMECSRPSDEERRDARILNRGRKHHDSILTR